MSADLLEGTTPTVGDTVRRNRGLVLIAVIVVVVAVIMAVAQSRRTAGVLDPDGYDRPGSHALAALLEDQGVDVVRVTTATDAADALAKAGGDATLLVVPTAPLSPRMLDAVVGSQRAHTVLVQPSADVLERLAPWATVGDFSTDEAETEPGCSWAVAQRWARCPPTARRTRCRARSSRAGAAWSSTPPEGAGRRP